MSKSDHTQNIRKNYVRNLLFGHGQILEKQCSYNLNFRVSMTILYTKDLSHMWCKLYFGLLRGHVKSHHFPERIDKRRHYFHFLYKFLGVIGRKQLEQPFWIMTWIYYYLLNRIRMDLALDNSCWIYKNI